ncbi:MAG: class I SAM-dependent methyltransferase [Planctomycetota bacterium]|jgi:hypothetical protein
MEPKETNQAIKEKFNLVRRRYDNLPWSSLRKYNRNDLADLLGELQFNVGAEIGVRRGRYSMYLCRQNPNLKLYCIDPWSAYHWAYAIERQERIYNVFMENISAKPYKNQCVVLRKTSMEALADIEDESLDFVFIDGDHTFDFVAPDIIYWSKKVKAGGIVACHDYYPFKWAGVQKAVDAYTHCHMINPWYVTKELEPTAFWVKPATKQRGA